MRKRFIYAIIIITLFLSCHKKEPLEPPYGDKPVYVVTNRDYTSYLLSCFNESEDYIHIMMYLMKYYPFDSTNGVSQLQKALIKANLRGVEVKVLLEKSDYNSSLNALNESTYIYLDSMGVDVRFDPVSVTTHSKLVIVDDKIAFVGSSNWSRSALEENNEVNVKIKEEMVVSELDSYFQRIWDVSGYKLK
ncbi:hypothetical protein KAX75_02280 [candidate division WOR-3 bacterium]|nr:hypothetical protein [candidate division WOR-3 bacterium]